MKIKVRLFASLRQYSEGRLPGTTFEVELAENACIQDLIEHLKIPLEETKVAFVNGLVQDVSYQLKADDEVGIFPPVGGG